MIEARNGLQVIGAQLSPQFAQSLKHFPANGHENNDPVRFAQSLKVKRASNHIGRVFDNVP